MPGKFEDRVAIVTGAGRGIGRETALLLAREGARVVINDLGGTSQGAGADGAVAQKVVDEIRAEGGEAVADTSSISSMAGGQAVVEAAMDNFGRIDILINNAGILRPKRIWEMEEDDFDRVLAVNLKGFFATVRHSVPHMMQQRHGSIVNLGSPSGFGHLGMSNYAAAKEGVVGFTRSIARDLGEHGIRCNVVRPRAVRSAMQIPEVYETIRYTVEHLKIPYLGNQWFGSGGIEGLPEHVAAVVAWLCTDLSASLNGQEIYVCGGQVSLVQQPELIRTQCRGDGWTFEALCTDDIVNALTYGQSNRFTGQG